MQALHFEKGSSLSDYHVGKPNPNEIVDTLPLFMNVLSRFSPLRAFVTSDILLFGECNVRFQSSLDLDKVLFHLVQLDRSLKRL